AAVILANGANRRLPSALHSPSRNFWLRSLREESSEQADCGKKHTDVIEDLDRGHVGEPAEKGRADAGNAEGEAEEQPRNHAHPSWNKPLCVNENRRECRCEDEADDDAQDRPCRSARHKAVP